uniref:MBL fold metallo-hydrolase n=1 Tax=candidate division WOR-3 bacterium TaxID=2052148 RepID=A0A7C3J6L2_UNCW3
MRITFFGATKEVTGSKFLLESDNKRILVECGLFQGRRKESETANLNFPFDPKSIDLLLISHAHIDHSGNIPNLIKQGFNSDIISTYATVDLLGPMLLDSAHIHEKDIEYLNKKNKNPENKKPLYTVDDVEKSLKYFKGVNYYNEISIDKELKVTFIDAGHILGSSQIIFEKDGKKLLFTGDLGRKHLPIIRNPDIVKDVDILITESTYGDRLHPDISESREKLKKVIEEVKMKKGNLIVPAFSVGRTQELLYDLFMLKEEGYNLGMKIFVDSPLTVNITKVFKEHPECYDKDMVELFNSGKDPFNFEDLFYIENVEESKKLNSMKEPKIIISASGMCEAGRILHHLKNNIENPANTILVTGFMASNTLGRKIVEKEEKVKIFGDEYRLKAEVVVMNEYSAHADRNDLINHIKSVNPKKEIYLVHGEENQIESLKGALKENGYKNVIIPSKGDSFDIF